MGILKNLLNTVAAYVPTEWVTGDIITAEKLNKLENGVADAGSNVEDFIVTFTDDGESITVDKTFSEIESAYTEGKKLVFIASIMMLPGLFVNYPSIQVQPFYNPSDATQIMNFTGTSINTSVDSSDITVAIIGTCISGTNAKYVKTKNIQ